MSTKPPRTPERVAERFRRKDGTIGVQAETLTDLLQRFGRPKIADE
jgi:hypothetical protein